MNKKAEKEPGIPFDKVLEFIDQDRQIPEDPFFYARLEARIKREQAERDNALWMRPWFVRLRPVLTGLAVVVLVVVGMGIGTALTRPSSKSQQITLDAFSGDDPAAMLLYQLSPQYEEQILVIQSSTP